MVSAHDHDQPDEGEIADRESIVGRLKELRSDFEDESGAFFSEAPMERAERT